jgi:Superfamily II DNA helicase
VQVADSLDKKLDRLIPFLKARTGPAIVYVTLQKHAEDVAEHLKPHGLEPLVYHAGISSEQRVKVQAEFMESTAGIVVCTIAFGMGIDKGVESFPGYRI